MFNRISLALTQLLQNPEHILKIVLHMLNVYMAKLPPQHIYKSQFSSQAFTKTLLLQGYHF